LLSRQNLLESNRLPFSLHIYKGSEDDNFIAEASIALSFYRWKSVSTLFSRSLKFGVWYTLDLAYDTDTLAIFVNGSIAALHAFPIGKIRPHQGHELHIGTRVDGVKYHFNGKIAALQLWSGIPPELEKQIDEHRNYPEWFISYKRISTHREFDLGMPISPITYKFGSYIQHHQYGAIMYRDGIGAAFEMHGRIYQFYQEYSKKAELGYLISDETKTSRGGRKNIFSKGAIYWSTGTGAIPVSGRMFIDYDSKGIATIGFPTKLAKPVPGGFEQEFEFGRMYYRKGSHTAFEVHGAILDKYLALGGVQTFGFPISDEVDIKNNGEVIGRMSEFEHCTIYWSYNTGAFEVHGDIRDYYLGLKGPSSDLGLPTSDEVNIPGVSELGKANTFEKGSLLWYGNEESIILACPFCIYLHRIDTQEDEGFIMGQNNLYFRLTIKEDGQLVFDQRYPKRGYFGERNIIEPKINIQKVFTPNNLNKTVTLTIEIKEYDPISANEHIGTYTKVLNSANGWGFRENKGILDSGRVSRINNVQWSVKRIVDPSKFPETKKFWGVKNRPTPIISKNSYAAAFKNVDNSREGWDFLDQLELLFYEHYIKYLASNGNGFGMVLEAIFARKNISRFGMPLDQYTNWNILEPEFNIKHCYQFICKVRSWFFDQFGVGKMQNPKVVFQKSRDAFYRGQHPVLCLAQYFDYRGLNHSVLPVSWNLNSTPWKIVVCDPDFPGTLKEVSVDPYSNTFKYEGKITYSGGPYFGGRMHFIPWNLFGILTPPSSSTNLQENLMEVMVSDAQTERITDIIGSDLDAYGELAKTKIRQGKSIKEFFVRIKGNKGELLMTTSPPPSPSKYFIPASLSREALFPSLPQAVPLNQANNLIDKRLLTHVLADPDALSKMNDDVIKKLKQIRFSPRRGDFLHRIKGVRNGGYLSYILKQDLKEIQILCEMNTSDSHDIQFRDLATSQASLDLKTNRDKLIKLVVNSKLGTEGDYIKISISKIPVSKKIGLKANIRPGLGGMDIITEGEQVEIPINIQGYIDKRKIGRKYQLPLKGGIRVHISDALNENGVILLKPIDNLFGPPGTIIH